VSNNSDTVICKEVLYTSWSN